MSKVPSAILAVGYFWGHPQVSSPRSALAACLLYPHHPHISKVVSLMGYRWQDGEPVPGYCHGTH